MIRRVFLPFKGHAGVKQAMAERLRGRPITVRCDLGRAKTSFYGALNLHTGQETVMDAPTLNAVTTVEYLRHILTTYPDQPRSLLWDRAP